MIIHNVSDIDFLLKTFNGKLVAIVTHENPDGDGLAACLALFRCLIEVYKAQPIIVMDTDFPDFLSFLNRDGIVVHSYEEIKNQHFDLLIALDCHDELRIDTNSSIYNICTDVIYIDHHEMKEQALHRDRKYYIDASAVSTGAIIHRFLFDYVKQFDKPNQKNYAEYIYTTIVNDTDNFLNTNVDKETYKICSDLLDLGLSPAKLTNKFLYHKSIHYYKYIGDVLSTIELFNDHKLAFYHSTIKMLEDNNQTHEALAKMMRWTKGAYDVEVQVLMQEYEHQDYRISLRSDRFDVSLWAKHFGGGGHKRASGFSLKGSFNEVKTTILAYFEEQMSECRLQFTPPLSPPYKWGQ